MQCRSHSFRTPLLDVSRILWIGSVEGRVCPAEAMGRAFNTCMGSVSTDMIMHDRVPRLVNIATAIVHDVLSCAGRSTSTAVHDRDDYMTIFSVHRASSQHLHERIHGISAGATNRCMHGHAEPRGTIAFPVAHHSVLWEQLVGLGHCRLCCLRTKMCARCGKSVVQRFYMCLI